MPRKVFMSVLGTGKYLPCTYKGEKSETTTNYIQEATLNEIGAASWGEEDAVYILLTEKARKVHWAPNDRDSLNSILKNLGLRCTVEGVSIPDGQNEMEMWDIFSTIFGLLKDGDELYFDLTHGFRTLPMLLLVLGNYAKFLKNTRIAYMSYGNWEARENDVAPIIDLLPLVALQDWTTAASSFRETGRVEILCSFLKEIVRNTAAPKNKGHLLKLLTNLESFQLQSETCCGKQICDGKAAGDVVSYTELVIKDGFLPDPVRPILLSIKDEAVPFAGQTTDNIIRQAILRCKKYGLIQQGYTMCQEGIVTIVCEKFAALNPYTKGSRSKDYKKYREYWSSILGISDNDKLSSAKWKPILKDNRELTCSIFALDWVGELRKRYSKLTRGRNHVNHGGFTGDLPAKKIRDEFSGIVDDFLDFCGWKLESPKPASSPEPPIFFNLSNHPSDKWTEEQRKAAEQYGEIIDLPFPAINSAADGEEITLLAEVTFNKILSLAEGKSATVHLMGEMTFTYALVTRLKDAGIRCVASTTDRMVSDNADGTRITQFHFVRFREYE